MTFSGICASLDKMLAQSRYYTKTKDYYKARELLREYVKDCQNYGFNLDRRVLKRLNKLERKCR